MYGNGLSLRDACATLLLLQVKSRLVVYPMDG